MYINHLEALNKRERVGVGGRGPSLASWVLNEREMADVGDVARRVGVLGATPTRESGCR